jgi:hypothetical protein
MSDDYNLKFLRRYPNKCSAEVTRQGESEPCDKVAVAVMKGEGCDYKDEPDDWWPVCAYHVRKDYAVPLADLIKALDGGRS